MLGRLRDSLELAVNDPLAWHYHDRLVAAAVLLVVLASVIITELLNRR